MYHIEDNSPTLAAVSAVTGSIIRLRPPIREILSKFNSSAQDTSQDPRAKGRLSELQTRVESHVTAHQGHELARTHFGKKRFDPFERMGKGLLDKEMTPLLGCE
jgi:hypothetical protein